MKKMYNFPFIYPFSMFFFLCIVRELNDFIRVKHILKSLPQYWFEFTDIFYQRIKNWVIKISNIEVEPQPIICLHLKWFVSKTVE
jgi:hypothetical protein